MTDESRAPRILDYFLLLLTFVQPKTDTLLVQWSSDPFMYGEVCLYISKTNLPVIMDVTEMMQPINGCKLLDVEIEALALEGLSPKPAVVPPYPGLLLFKIDGLIELQKRK